MKTPPILIVTGDFVKTGGMDRANYALADHLSQAGREVHLIAYRAGAELLARPNVVFHRVPKPLNSYTLGGPLLARFGRSVAKTVAGQGGTVVVNGGNCRWGDVNWVHHVNLLDTPKPGGNLWRRFKTQVDYKLHTSAERAALSEARLIVTTCERNKADIHAHFGIPLDRIVTIYYGTDPGVFRPATPEERRGLRAGFGWAPDRPVYAFAGALSDRRKGFDTLFEAWAQLCRRSDWDADLIVIGSGSELAAWRERAESGGLADRIRFLGFRRDVPDLFRACDAHILPSRYEGYSLVTQEALCCDLPAFVTRVAGIAERFPGPLADALLIPDPDDAAALADRLLAWRGVEEGLRPDLGRFSDSLRSYTWDDMAEQFARVHAR
jgi:glycosyltransferase involved in cell wall biosynthesis